MAAFNRKCQKNATKWRRRSVPLDVKNVVGNETETDGPLSTRSETVASVPKIPKKKANKRCDFNHFGHCGHYTWKRVQNINNKKLTQSAKYRPFGIQKGGPNKN